MSKLKVIIVADRFCWGSVRACVDSIDVSKFDIIVANNGSALIKEDLIPGSYTEFYDSAAEIPYGKIIQDVLHAVGIDTGIVIVNPCVNCDIMEAIAQLEETADSNTDIAMVSVGFNECKQVVAPRCTIVYIPVYYLDDDLFDKDLITERATLLNAALKIMYESTAIIYEIDLNHRFSVNPFIEKNYSESEKERDRRTMKAYWGMKYFNTEPNLNIVVQVVATAKKGDKVKILEVGCDLGVNLLNIKRMITMSGTTEVETYGIEVNPQAAGVADNLVDDVRCIDIEDDIPEAFYDRNSFDFIIFGDVLEHLKDPERVLRLSKCWLKPDGKIVASIPNLMNISVIEELLKGNFTYTDRGLLDRTHCHFFTGKEIEKMFTNTGYDLEMVSLKGTVNSVQMELIKSLIDLGDKSVTEEAYTTFQYLCIATKK